MHITMYMQDKIYDLLQEKTCNPKDQSQAKAPKTQCFRGFYGVPDTIRTCDLQSRRPKIRANLKT